MKLLERSIHLTGQSQVPEFQCIPLITAVNMGGVQM